MRMRNTNLKKKLKLPGRKVREKHLLLKVKYNFLSNASRIQKCQADTPLVSQFSGYPNAYFFIRPTFFLFSYFLNQNRGKMYYTLLNFLKQNRRHLFWSAASVKQPLGGNQHTGLLCLTPHTLLCLQRLLPLP